MAQTRPAGTVAIETHGCKLNLADSQALAARFVAGGFQVVAPHQPVDVYVVNTCTVTREADAKARQSLRAAHRRSPQALIVATGCSAQRVPEEMARLEGVTLVIGNQGKEGLVEQVLLLRGEVPVPAVAGVAAPWSGGALFKTRAMVKIQEGCDQVCAYCIVPRVRGREQSVPPDLLVARLQECEAQGYQEAVLTGTQLGSYGLDLPGMSLRALLERLLQETRGLRLRVSSLQPQEITPELLDLWQDPRLCPHLHIPLQSGSDRVLRRMRRRYTRAQYAATFARVWARLPDAAITSDVLVGFPGETEEEFGETEDLCRALPFARIHVFPYSARPGTSAALFKDQVPAGEKAERARRLQALARQQEEAFRQRFVGALRPVLWEKQGSHQGSPVWRGLSDNYLRVWSRAQAPLGGRVTATRLGPVAASGALWGEPVVAGRPAPQPRPAS